MKKRARRIMIGGSAAMCALLLIDSFGARLGSWTHDFTTIGVPLTMILCLIGSAMTDAANDASRSESSETKWSQFRAVAGLTETAATNSILFLIGGALLLVVALIALLLFVQYLS